MGDRVAKQLDIGLRFTLPYVHTMFTLRVPYVHRILTLYLPYVYAMLTLYVPQLFFDVHLMLTVCPPYFDIMFLMFMTYLTYIDLCCTL